MPLPRLRFSFCSLLCVVAAGRCFGGDEPRSPATPVLIEHPPALSPEESRKQFTVAEGLSIGLVVAEPDVTQPLSITFDDRGRMWVLQYRQYPNPNGLKAVEMDNWLRTKYDKVPEPPPKGPHGNDRISIYEDANGDGRPETVTTFLDDLNLASGMALGYGGVFVVQPPYLLFYADADRNDVPDGPPEVLLKGFGMEDAHAFANSLTWGPDGWLYGCQGSTATAKIRGIEFQQGLWRYHPRTKEFELFAEGGGNSWGVEFDAMGNVFAAGNTVEPLVHHVQGAYYVKGFGKHGPLHNPHAYGYFQPVLHQGYPGDSLTGGAVLYQGGAFPARFNGACIAPNTRHSACRWSTLETRGSTFATRHGGDFVTSKDIWFRPVDMAVGPDGAVYIADWYDYNISHSSPVNRSEWYQPSRLDGRVWRVAPPDVPPVASRSFDLARRTSAELVGLLSHPNDWYARQARRILAERRDGTVVPPLTKLALESADQRLALQGLWSLYVSGGLNDGLAIELLNSRHEYARAWVVRLLGDERSVSPRIHDRFVALAQTDDSVIVRSQLACTAKRLPGEQCLEIVAGLLRRDEDADDVHVPLLLWWAVEDKAIGDADRVLSLFQDRALWQRPIVSQTIIERLARRYVAEGSDAGYAAAAVLLQTAPSPGERDRVVRGFLAALAGRKLDEPPQSLKPLVLAALEQRPSPNEIELGLRLNLPGAESRALSMATDSALPPDVRATLIRSLGETRAAGAVNGLLEILQRDDAEAIQLATLTALGFFEDERIASVVLERFPHWRGSVPSRAVELLASRPAWAKRLAAAVDRKEIPPAAVSVELVRTMQGHADPALQELLEKHWGRVKESTPLEIQGRIAAVSQLLNRGRGDAASGRVHFEKICATCHKLHGQGQAIGPDLTGAERKNRELLVRNLIDPSAVVREQFIMHVATTQDGRVLEGLLAESTPETITLLDAKNKRTVLRRAELDELQESPVSLMPEKLLDGLTDQQIRDLFAYLQSDPGR